jgi:hypothetical protein
MMHDWWLMLVAGAFGRIGHLAEPTVLYRQHGANDTGAKIFSATRLLLDARDLGVRKERNRSIRRQAAVFLERYRSKLEPEVVAMLECYANLDRAGCVRQRLALFRYGFWSSGLLRNIGRLIVV